MHIWGTGNHYEEQPARWMWSKQFWKPFLMRPLAFWMGIVSVRYKSHKISDFLSDYEKYEAKMADVHAPISISNHHTGFDIITLLDIHPCLSFLAKIGIKGIPSIGKICTRLQSIYIHRGDKSQAQAVIEKIKKRCDDILIHKKRFPSLMIFPEGTTGNGEFLMRFKNGAFINGAPIKIYCLRYRTSGLNPGLNLYREPVMFTMNLSNWWDKLVIHEFETPFDPQYVAEKYGISIDHESFPELFIKEVRYLYEYAWGFGQATNGISEKMEMEIAFGMELGYEKRKGNEKDTPGAQVKGVFG
jgi:1-acyl-sn-glycerol-3-phosphate acyltransferase